MPVVQEDRTHPGLLWVQCPECKEIKPIESGNSQGGKNSKEPENGSRKVVRHYRAGERFEKGEWVYHPGWRDTGQIIEKCVSTGGKEIIVVSFERLGTKRLVTNFAR